MLGWSRAETPPVVPVRGYLEETPGEERLLRRPRAWFVTVRQNRSVTLIFLSRSTAVSSRALMTVTFKTLLLPCRQPSISCRVSGKSQTPLMGRPQTRQHRRRQLDGEHQEHRRRSDWVHVPGDLRRTRTGTARKVVSRGTQIPRDVTLEGSFTADHGLHAQARDDSTSHSIGHGSSHRVAV